MFIHLVIRIVDPDAEQTPLTLVKVDPLLIPVCINSRLVLVLRSQNCDLIVLKKYSKVQIIVP